MRSLTEHQRAFVAAYLATNNASESYRRAYPASLHWKQTSISPTALRTLYLPKVSAAIKEQRDKVIALEDISAGWVLKRLKAEATAGDPAEPNPTRVAALHLIGKHYRLFPETTEARNINLDLRGDLRTFSLGELRELLRLTTPAESPALPPPALAEAKDGG